MLSFLSRIGEGKKKPFLRPPNSKVDVGNSPLLCCATKSEASHKAPARLLFSDLQKEIQARPGDQVLMLSPSRNPVTTKAGLSRSHLSSASQHRRKWRGLSEFLPGLPFSSSPLRTLPEGCPWHHNPGFNYGEVLPLSCWSYEDRSGLDK